MRLLARVRAFWRGERLHVVLADGVCCVCGELGADPASVCSGAPTVEDLTDRDEWRKA